MASYTAIKDYLEYKGRIGTANNSPELILGPSNIARRDRQIMSCYLNSLEKFQPVFGGGGIYARNAASR